MFTAGLALLVLAVAAVLMAVSTDVWSSRRHHRSRQRPRIASKLRFGHQAPVGGPSASDCPLIAA